MTKKMEFKILIANIKNFLFYKIFMYFLNKLIEYFN